MLPLQISQYDYCILLFRGGSSIFYGAGRRQHTILQYFPKSRIKSRKFLVGEAHPLDPPLTIVYSNRYRVSPATAATCLMKTIDFYLMLENIYFLNRTFDFFLTFILGMITCYETAYQEVSFFALMMTPIYN